MLGGGRLDFTTFIKGWDKINNNMGLKALRVLDFRYNEGIKNVKMRFLAPSDINIYLVTFICLDSAAVGVSGTSYIDTANTFLGVVDGTIGVSATSLSNYTHLRFARDGSGWVNEGQVLITKITSKESFFTSTYGEYELRLKIDLDVIKNVSYEGRYYSRTVIMIDDNTSSFKYDNNPIKKNNQLMYTDIDNIINYLNKSPVFYGDTFDSVMQTYGYLEPDELGIYNVTKNGKPFHAYTDNYVYERYLVPTEYSQLSYIEATAIANGVNIPLSKKIAHGYGKGGPDWDSPKLYKELFWKNPAKNLKPNSYYYEEFANVVFNKEEANAAMDTNVAKFLDDFNYSFLRY